MSSPAARPSQRSIFPALRRKEDDGLLVSIQPNEAQSWLGIFAFGGYGPVIALSSTPDPDILFVVSRGAGYYIRADDPKAWTEIEHTIPTDIRIIPDRELIVLVDFTSIAAYNTDGLIWRTPRISWDGIRVTSIGAGYIEGLAWDPTMKERPKFRVNLDTGEHEGGSSPKVYDV
jgi:hypothetical protein